MYPELKDRLNQLLSTADASLLANRQIGLEKETLRIDAEGRISQTDHPAKLGSALCNSRVTTDFSEALLEMVTPPCANVTEALKYLTGLHQFILQRMAADEGLWNTSMPCVLHGDDSIRIGRYGTSHNGVMKHVYRRGLGLRYGKRMQAIAGIHFNFSLPESSWPVWQQLHKNDAVEFGARTEGYFHMTRNLMRIGWLVPYLFGASPAICQTFLPSGADSDLATLNKSTRYAPFGTSLRMGEIGYRYREDAPIDLSVRHCHFGNYLDDILAHVATEHPAYAQQGLHDAAGNYQQLSTARLQIENEYYSSVRPKQIPEKGEMPILALQRKGIRYLELRSVDVGLHDAAGMHLEQIAMLELMMLFAWLNDSGPLSQQEMDDNKHNVQTVAHRGREPGLQLVQDGKPVGLQQWGKQILEMLQPLAAWLDADSDDSLYQRSLQLQLDKINDPSLTPSARIVDELADYGSFFDMAMQVSDTQKQALLSMPVDQALQSELAGTVQQSLKDQAALEAATKGDFEQFRLGYFSQLAHLQAGCA